jgi:hypothetical protein
VHKGLIEGYLHVIGFEFFVKVRVLREALHAIIVKVYDPREADSSPSRLSVFLEDKLELHYLIEA